MTEAPWGGQDSRPAENPPPQDGAPGIPAPHGDVYMWYQRAWSCWAGAARRPPPSCWNGPPRLSRGPAACWRPRPGPVRHPPLRRGGRDLPADRRGQPERDYAQFGLGLALAGAGPAGRAEHLALAAAMRPELRHYTDALRGVRPP